ncbi:MAG TPA: helix-turn-helix domain-containing protein [Anaerolineae bacterium]|nr:helix-turn-helix domain-containing protein [Anaerolineae bacterium]
MAEVDSAPVCAPNLDLFTVAECAAILKVSRKLITHWVNVGALPAVRLGPGQRLIRVPKRALEAFIEQGGTAAAQP